MTDRASNIFARLFRPQLYVSGSPTRGSWDLPWIEALVRDTSQSSGLGKPLFWVAVKGLKLSCHDSKAILLTIYP